MSWSARGVGPYTSKARATAPELGLAYEVEGILADEAEKPDEAKAAYAKASAIGGAGFHAEFRLAWLMWPKPDAANRDAVFGQMVPILERSIAANPSYGWSRSLLAQALLELDRVGDAAAQAQRAVVLAPEGSPVVGAEPPPKGATVAVGGLLASIAVEPDRLTVVVEPSGGVDGGSV